jgi:HD-like signal output (HDOD) protein
MSTAAAAPTAADPRKMITTALDGVAGLATLPEVTAAIIKTVEDPRSDAAKLHKIVANDPALVSRVLKLVNSAFYGLPGRVASIDRAIVMLGLNAVKNLAVAASLGQMFRGTQLCEGFTAKDLWAHCVGVACASRDLAKQARLPIVDEAFLGGMIHDIGLLVSLQVWPEQLRAACEEARRTGRPFCEVEREIVGVDHQILGKALCEKWSFPQACRLVAQSHHSTSTRDPIVAVVATADALVVSMGIGFTLTRPAGETTFPLAAAAGVTPAMIEATKGRLPELLRAASALSE